MHLVSRVLVSGSMLALGVGMLGGTASAATFATDSKVQTTRQVATQDDLSAFNVSQSGEFSTFVTSGPLANEVSNGELTEHTDQIQMIVNLKTMNAAQIGSSVLEISDENGNPKDLVPASLQVNGDIGVMTFYFEQGVMTKGTHMQMSMFSSLAQHDIFDYTVK